MSLHLANLPSRIRQDELERVFRRFGECNVQLKDKFGFVVYDFPANAEKALRTLRGKSICGEPITLSWSNRQPRPLQRFARGGRSYESHRGRHSAREAYGNRKLHSSGHRDYGMAYKQSDGDRAEVHSVDLVDEARSYHKDNNKDIIGEKHHDLGDDFPDEGGGVEQNVLQHDRWGEQVAVPSKENELEFDRYEPYGGDDRRDEDENHHLTHAGGSPTLGRSQEKSGIEQIGETASNHPNNKKYQQTCYICREIGHKMRNCPRDNAYRGTKLSRFDRQRDDVINFRGKDEGELKRHGYKSQRRPQPSRYAQLMRQRNSDRKTSSSRKHRSLIISGSSPLAMETHRSKRKDYVEKKQKRKENESPERYRVKKARGAVSSSIHSDYTASTSRSHSKSSKFRSSSSHSRSRSVSSRTRSLSSSSSSGSTLHHSRFRSAKSGSRSRSRSPTSLSLSVSLDRHLPSSPNKIQINQDSLVNATNPESKECVVERGQLVEGGDGSNNSKHKNMIVAMENESAMPPFVAEEDMDKDHSQRRDDENNNVISMVSGEVEDSHALPLENVDPTSSRLSLESSRVMRELPNSDVFVTNQMLITTKNPTSEVSLRSHVANSTTISPEEMFMVLKHYDLEQPDENGKDLSVEAYFGSARLWPWEIIYYRRLKKGPISTENYARRIAQNKEFGIDDKYIRSSSGWGELVQDDA